MDQHNKPAAFLVMTNGVYLHCPPNERFYINLASHKVSNAVLEQNFDMENTTIKLGTHTHVGFFSDVIEDFLPPGAAWRMLDIGGYIGAIGIPVANWAKDHFTPEKAHVDIFEPTHMSELIGQSIILNNLEEIAKVHQFAVSNKTGEAVFSYIDGQKVAGRIGESCASKTIVNTIKLDHYMPDFRDGLLIVKIDTEGHEPSVLAGMLQLLEQNRVIAIIEFHSYCIGQKIGDTTYQDFLFDRFHLFDVGNIGYPKDLLPIEYGSTEALRALDRDGGHLTDILCIDNRIPMDLVIKFCDRYSMSRSHDQYAT